MTRALVIWLCCLLLLIPTAGWAQSYEDRVVRQLQKLGYEQISVGRTLLGRSRITARNPEGRREIVLNPRSGEILRDYIHRDKANARDSWFGILNGDDDDDDRDDDGDDRDDDDDDDDRGSNSGRGSGNSGSDGSGNSGPGGGGDDDDDDD